MDPVGLAYLGAGLGAYTGLLLGTLAAPTPVSALVHAGLVSGAGLLLIRFSAPFIASDVAVITAFVSEYFGGRQNGLAYSITSSINGSKDVMWAYVVGACALGLIFYLASVGLERLATPQGPSTASRGSVPGGAATS